MARPDKKAAALKKADKPAAETNAQSAAAEESKPAAGDQPVKPMPETSSPAKSVAAEPASTASGEPAKDEDAPVANGTNGTAEKTEEPEKKKVKKEIVPTVPSWASMSAKEKNLHANKKKAAGAKGSLVEEIVNAVKECRDSRGNVSAQALRKYVLSENPQLQSHHVKKALAKAVEKGFIVQKKGAGFSGQFGMGKKPYKDASKKARFEDVLPLVMTWACNPKEASVALIRKYIAENYPNLDADGKPFKNAILSGEKKGQLDRISGKGTTGTFGLMDGAKKTGAVYEDAIESAIIAMNEPKTASISMIRDYIREYHKEITVVDRPNILKNTIEKLEAMGWVQRLSGKGLGGTLLLKYKYYPSPKELWGDEYSERSEGESSSKKKVVAKQPKRKYAEDSDSEEESESEEEEAQESDSDSDMEVLPKAKNRANAPSAISRRPVPAAAKKKGAAAAPKKKPAAAKKGRRK